MHRVGRILLGLACGWALSRLRLVPGGAWLDGPVAAASEALLVRGFALAFVGLALRRLQRGASIEFLGATALACAGHGLLIGSPFGLPMWDVLALGVLLGLGSWLARRDERPDEEGEAIAPAHWGERVGLFLCGGGAALVLEVVARHVRLLGGGLAQDDSALGVTFLALLAFGAACFGWLANARRAARWALPLLVAAAAATCLGSLALLKEIGQIHQYAQFLQRYGLDTSWHATLAADGLVAGAAFVAPAFLLGVALRGARGAGSLSSALVGAGAGLALLPHLLARDPGAPTSEAELFSAQLVPLGVLVAVAGAALAVLSVPGTSARARWTAFAVAAPLALPVLLVPVSPLFLLSPWERYPTMPFLAFETPEGLATVEPADGGLKAATLDRRLLSPGLAGTGSDREQLRAAFASLPAAAREREGGVRVLLVGQLTLLRAAWLAELGAGRVDRTGAWHAAMPRLEEALLGDAARPAGEVLAPDAAAERLAAGAYDLAVVPVVGGDPPAWRDDVRAPAQTVVVRWSALEEQLLAALPPSRFAGRGEERAYLLAAGGLDRPALGVATNARWPDGDEDGRAEVVRLEERPPRASPLALLLERKVFRADAARRASIGALAAEDPRALLRGYDAWCRIQVPSSPFETEAERVELDGACLDLLTEAALAAPPSLFTRAVWEWLARVLQGKRDVTAITMHLEPLARRWAPWPALEVALARADLEALDPQAALARLEPLARGAGPSAEVLATLAAAREAAGDAPGALAAWREAVQRRPGDHGLERRLAMALVRAGDPEGGTLVRRLLAEDPEDEELKAFQGPGPWPQPPAGFQPDPRHH